MVFITVQNLVGIDAVVLIICTFGLKTPIHGPKLGIFRAKMSNLVRIDEEMRP